VTEDSALILIEFQREWLDEDGKLFFLMQDQEQFQSAIQAAKQLLEAARQSEIKIVHCGLSFILLDLLYTFALNQLCVRDMTLATQLQLSKMRVQHLLNVSGNMF
jgi:Isochorismatase family